MPEAQRSVAVEQRLEALAGCAIGLRVHLLRICSMTRQKQGRRCVAAPCVTRPCSTPSSSTSKFFSSRITSAASFAMSLPVSTLTPAEAGQGSSGHIWIQPGGG